MQVSHEGQRAPRPHDNERTSVGATPALHVALNRVSAMTSAAPDVSCTTIESPGQVHGANSAALRSLHTISCPITAPSTTMMPTDPTVLPERPNLQQCGHVYRHTGVAAAMALAPQLAPKPSATASTPLAPNPEHAAAVNADSSNTASGWKRSQLSAATVAMVTASKHDAAKTLMSLTLGSIVKAAWSQWPLPPPRWVCVCA